ncbi:hypothetical protein DSO57_1008819 [Entomophthora muscae]|uniref:Uncharacterized protein n=1 Tax=Entomophthora muscae TaxID=34485 RepID=A0ACC2RLL9_9FUNG|nr:hypothetical protein DSO57_1008819 [Entomophthora muscae]
MSSPLPRSGPGRLSQTNSAPHRGPPTPTIPLMNLATLTLMLLLACLTTILTSFPTPSPNSCLIWN